MVGCTKSLSKLYPGMSWHNKWQPIYTLGMVWLQFPHVNHTLGYVWQVGYSWPVILDYKGYGWMYKILIKTIPWYELAQQMAANLYPGYGLATISTCEPYPGVCLAGGVWLACYTRLQRVWLDVQNPYQNYTLV